MAADLEKPYSTVWFEGQMHDIRNLRGGHNGRTSGACASNGVIFNPQEDRWEVRVANNLIHFEFPTAFGPAEIKSMEPEDNKLEGLVVSTNNEIPTLPAVSPFEVRLEALLPGGLKARSKGTLKLSATVNAWPPPPETAYLSERPVEFFLEGSPDDAKPIFIINPDQTVVKSVNSA